MHKVHTFVGSGHSSSSNVITAGPRGSDMGIAVMSAFATSNQPVSVSAILCRFNMAGGGSVSLKQVTYTHNHI